VSLLTHAWRGVITTAPPFLSRWSRQSQSKKRSGLRALPRAADAVVLRQQRTMPPAMVLSARSALTLRAMPHGPRGGLLRVRTAANRARAPVSATRAAANTSVRWTHGTRRNGR
jgi:hypothetical protein